MKYSLISLLFILAVVTSCRKNSGIIGTIPALTPTEKLLTAHTWYLQKEVDSSGFWFSHYSMVTVYTGYSIHNTLQFLPAIFTDYGAFAATDSSGLSYVYSPPALMQSLSDAQTKVWSITNGGNCILWDDGLDSTFIVALDDSQLILQGIQTYSNITDTQAHLYWYYSK